MVDDINPYTMCGEEFSSCIIVDVVQIKEKMNMIFDVCDPKDFVRVRFSFNHGYREEQGSKGFEDVFGRKEID